MDSISAECSAARWRCLPYPPLNHAFGQRPRHGDRRRRLVSGAIAQLLQFLETRAGDTGMKPPGIGTPQCARSNLHRHCVGIIGGDRVGDLPRALPTQARAGDIAVGRPCCCSHVPVVCGAQIPGGLQMLGDQCRVLVAHRPSGCNNVRKPAVQRGAIRLQLGLVGHPMNQRVAEPELSPRRERHLIDQFRLEELRQRGAVGEFGQQVLVESHTDDRRGVERFLAAASSRSILAAIAAWRVTGTVTSAWSRVHTYSPRAPSSTFRSARSRTMDSAKKGLPAARSAICETNPATDGCEPNNSSTSDHGLRIIQRCKKNGLCAGNV